MNVLLTGGTGFVGTAVVERLLPSKKFRLRVAVRRDNHCLSSMAATVRVGDLASDSDWKSALQGVDVVIHLAARAHMTQKTDPIHEFREVNVAGTLNLARQAASTGVKRFVFISSIGVNGNCNERPFVETDIPNPVEPYAVSKLEAEEGLQRLAYESGLEIVIIRPPLVYGPNAPGNFGRLFKVVAKGIPLPLGAIHNKRSLVALDNLVDLIVTCLEHPAAANQIFLAGDGEDLSTTELLRRLGGALGRPVHLLPVPQWLLNLCFKIVGKPDLGRRLCGSLRIDISKAKKLLDWQPPLSIAEELKKTAEWHLRAHD